MVTCDLEVQKEIEQCCFVDVRPLCLVEVNGYIGRTKAGYGKVARVKGKGQRRRKLRPYQ
jgi:hypothetical protein